MPGTRSGWGAALLALGLATGCAGDQPRAEGGGLWDGVSVQASEVDPPGSLEELEEDAPTIVRGRVVDVFDVPSSESGIPPSDPVVALVVEVEDAVRGAAAAGGTIKIVRPRQPAVSVAQLAASLPHGAVLFFLEPAGFGAYHGTTSDLGVIAEIGGVATTVLDPARSADVLGAGRSVDDVVEELMAG